MVLPCHVIGATLAARSCPHAPSCLCVTPFRCDCPTNTLLFTPTKIAAGISIPINSLVVVAAAGWLSIGWSRRKSATRSEPAPLYMEAENKSAYVEVGGERPEHKHKIAAGTCQQSTIMDSRLEGSVMSSREQQLPTRRQMRYAPGIRQIRISGRHQCHSSLNALLRDTRSMKPPGAYRLFACYPCLAGKQRMYPEPLGI